MVRDHRRSPRAHRRLASRTPTQSPAAGRSPGASSDGGRKTDRRQRLRVELIAGQCDFVVCAVDMDKAATAKLEEDYARAETPVVSNNSAHRWTPDVPMMIPEINADHMASSRRSASGSAPSAGSSRSSRTARSRATSRRSIRSRRSGRRKIAVCTYQAISGAGKTFETWPEMIDNVIPFIKGEEEKSEKEPLKVWGQLRGGEIVTARRR